MAGLEALPAATASSKRTLSDWHNGLAAQHSPLLALPPPAPHSLLRPLPCCSCCLCCAPQRNQFLPVQTNPCTCSLGKLPTVKILHSTEDVARSTGAAAVPTAHAGAWTAEWYSIAGLSLNRSGVKNRTPRRGRNRQDRCGRCTNSACSSASEAVHYIFIAAAAAPPGAQDNRFRE